jgi:hypothetical protein
MSEREISGLPDLPDELILLDDGFFAILRESVPDPQLAPNVLVLSVGRGGILWPSYSAWPLLQDEGMFDKSTLAWLIVKAIGCGWKLPDGWMSKGFIEELEGSTEVRKVGTSRGSPISARAYLLKKPVT